MSLFALLCSLAAAAGAPAATTLTLDEALHNAVTHSPQLQASSASYRARSAAVGSAFARFLPTLDTQIQYQRTTGNFVLSPAFAQGSFIRLATNPATGKVELNNSWNTVDYLVGGLTLNVVLFDFGKTGGAYDRAKASQREGQGDLDSATINVAYNVRFAYYTALANRELLQVANETVQNQQKHVDEIDQLVAAGRRPKIDLSTAQVKLDNTSLTLLRNKNSLDVAKVQLNQAMGIEGSIDYDLSMPQATALPEETQSVETVMAAALAQRPEFAKVTAQLAQVEAQNTVARAAYFPTLVGTSNIQGARVKDYPIGWNWYAGVGLNWNLFAGNLTPHQMDEAQANHEGLEAQRDVLQQSVRAEIMQLLLGVAEAKARVEVTEHASRTADEALQLAEGRYKTGVSTILELDDAQISRANAQAQKVQADYDLSMARARLLRAVGKSGQD